MNTLSLYFLGVLGDLAVQLHFPRFAPVHPLQRHRNLHAAVTRERSAALMLFQRPSPGQPPHKNVDPAVSRELLACHFGG
jgi:hypothetical protein